MNDVDVVWLGENPDDRPRRWLVSLGPVWPATSGAAIRHHAAVTAALSHDDTGILFVQREPPTRGVREWAASGSTPIGWIRAPDAGLVGRARVAARVLFGRQPYHVVVMRIARKKCSWVFDGSFVCLVGGAAGFVEPGERSKSTLSLCDFDPEYAQNLFRDQRQALRKLLAWVSWRRSSGFFASAYASFGEVVTISDEDRTSVLQLAPSASVRTIALSVPGSTTDVTCKPPGRLVFVGSGSRNLASIRWSVEHVLPVAIELGFDRPFELAGRFTPDEMAHIDSDWRRAGLPGEHLLFVVDPLDIGTVLAPGAVLLTPFAYGAGVKVKCADAMLRGALVVTNRAGAWGTALEDGVTGVVREAGAEIAEQLVRVFCEPGYGVALAAAGQRAAAGLHNEDRYTEAWNGICRLDGDV